MAGFFVLARRVTLSGIMRSFIARWQVDGVQARLLFGAAVPKQLKLGAVGDGDMRAGGKLH